MTKEEPDIQRKLKVLRHAEKTGHVARTCRYFGVGRSSFYRWRAAYEQRGEAGLINQKPIPKNPANQTPPEIVEKVLYLRSKYHLGSIRIVWYLARYHGIKISDAGVTRILRRNGVGRLPAEPAFAKSTQSVITSRCRVITSRWMSSSSPSSASVARKSAGPIYRYR